MANDSIPRPDARFHARRNNFATNVNGHPADLGLATTDPLLSAPSELGQKRCQGPPRDEQDAIAAALKTLDERTRAEKTKERQLIRAKAALSQALLTGRVRCRKAVTA